MRTNFKQTTHFSGPYNLGIATLKPELLDLLFPNILLDRLNSIWTLNNCPQRYNYMTKIYKLNCWTDAYHTVSSGSLSLMILILPNIMTKVSLIRITLVSTEHKLLEMCFLFLVPFDSINNLLAKSFDPVDVLIRQQNLPLTYIYVYKKKKKKREKNQS